MLCQKCGNVQLRKVALTSGGYVLVECQACFHNQFERQQKPRGWVLRDDGRYYGNLFRGEITCPGS